MSKSSRPPQSTIIIGVIGFDCHAVGNTILEYFFTEAGYKVINLKSLVSQQEFIDAAIESDARAILVSSLYGHAELDCEGFCQRCRDAGLNSVLYIGGNLVVGKTDFKEVRSKFRAMGFDRVFDNDCDLYEVEKLLREDIKARS